LACEYAKCKNRTDDFAIEMSSVALIPVLRDLTQEIFVKRTAMTDDPSSPSAAIPGAARKPLTPAAQRALAEAEARRKAAAASAPPAKELQGPKGPEPTRYGDWERKGIASDF
jgi:hypothetical protein